MERLAKAMAAGVSKVDVALVGVLLTSTLKSLRELAPDHDNTQVAVVVGMALGSSVALGSPDAGAEMLRVLGFMLDEQEAMAHMREETVRLYLDTRAENLAMEGRRG